MGVISSGSRVLALPVHAITVRWFFFLLEFAAVKQRARLFLGGFWMFILRFNSLK